MSFLLSHTKPGFCILDLIALIFLVLMVIYTWKKCHDQKQEQKELEDRLSELYADETVEGSETVK